MQIKIRKLEQKDLDDVFKISQRELQDESWGQKQFFSCIEDSSYISYVASHNEQILGFIIAQDLIDSINILLIATKKEFRGFGIGTKLISELTKNQSKKVWLEVDEKNSAITFYEKCGFKFLYERKKYYPNGNSALIFELLP